MALPNRLVNFGLWLLPQALPNFTSVTVPASALCPSGEIRTAYDCALCGFTVTIGAPITSGTLRIDIKNETQNNILTSETITVLGGRTSYAYAYDPQIDIGTDQAIKCLVTTSTNFFAGSASVTITPIFSF